MEKRVTVLFSLLMALLCIAIFNLYSMSKGSYLQETAFEQNSYKLKIADLRGSIYDCHKKSLVKKEKIKIAAIVPSIKTIEKVRKILPTDKMDEILPLLGKKEPFVLPLPQGIDEINGIRIFNVVKREQKNRICPHVIGYLDNAGEGVYGIEKSYNDYLNECGEISIRYKIDATGRVLDGENEDINDSSYLQSKGIVLTLDEKIQKIAQEAMKKYIDKGACIILEVPGGKIRACVSLPDFSPENIPSLLNDTDSPFLNRAFSAYNLGSVFKLITAASALEKGIGAESVFNCHGKVEIDGREFHCFGGKSHSLLDMTEALKLSCNTYFVDLANRMLPENILNIAYALGFGQNCELAPGLKSAKGNLPSKESLGDRKNLANLAFGQGELLATPLQVAGLVNTIAANGENTAPSLIEGVVDESLEYIQKHKLDLPKRVMSVKTAKILQKAMYESVESGTSAKGKPTNKEAGAKTSTAETGIMHEGHKVIQAWYAGFYPYARPQYAIVILGEDGVGGGETCGPVFRKICDNLP